MFNLLARLICLLSLSAVAVRAQGSGNQTEAAASKRIQQLQQQYNDYIFETLANRTTGCTYDKLQYRREWGSLTPHQRIAYTTAVQCLQTKPNLISAIRVPGARTRFDDIIATHIFQSPYIHFSVRSPSYLPSHPNSFLTTILPKKGIFLHWHRYYTYLYDRLLRTECAYTAPQPYWDWTLTYTNPLASKIFSGTPDSMGSNGVYIPNRNGTLTTAFGRDRIIPPATGGGCVFAGPFQNYTVNLGPVTYEPRVGSGSGLDYNPRCLRRDVSFEFASFTKPSDVLGLIDGDNEDFEAFAEYLETKFKNGLHASGHLTIGGDPGGDFYVSAGEPIFHLHHGMVDRLWTVWQGLGRGRVGEVYGTGTAFNGELDSLFFR
ncbi:MAG: hypothetical protein Q9169_007140 [Polycauliona sp. 2 TL-2023]